MEKPAYVPPDLTRVELGDGRAEEYWARTLETSPERLREAARKAGPLLENIKKELGSWGVG